MGLFKHNFKEVSEHVFHRNDQRFGYRSNRLGICSMDGDPVVQEQLSTISAPSNKKTPAYAGVFLFEIRFRAIAATPFHAVTENTGYCASSDNKKNRKAFNCAGLCASLDLLGCVIGGGVTPNVCGNSPNAF